MNCILTSSVSCLDFLLYRKPCLVTSLVYLQHLNVHFLFRVHSLFEAPANQILVQPAANHASWMRIWTMGVSYTLWALHALFYIHDCTESNLTDILLLVKTCLVFFSLVIQIHRTDFSTELTFCTESFSYTILICNVQMWRLEKE